MFYKHSLLPGPPPHQGPPSGAPQGEGSEVPGLPSGFALGLPALGVPLGLPARLAGLGFRLGFGWIWVGF